MATYVAFLRGINVGGHTVANDRLRALFEDCGFEAVWAFLASGNVVFQAAADAREPDGARTLARIEEQVEQRLEGALGYAVPAFVRTADHVAAVAAHTPFPDAPEGGKQHIGFLRAEPDPAVRDQVLALAEESDKVAFRGRELYWHVAGRFMDSALSGPPVGKVLGNGWTVRTANTVRRLAAKLPG